MARVAISSQEIQFCLFAYFSSSCLVFSYMATQYYSLNLAPSHIKSTLYRVIKILKEPKDIILLDFLIVQDYYLSCESSKVKQSCK